MRKPSAVRNPPPLGVGSVKWWAVTYGKEKLLGVIVVQGADLLEALIMASRCANSPKENGQTVFGKELLPEEVPPESFRNRLLNEVDLAAMIEAKNDR